MKESCKILRNENIGRDLWNMEIATSMASSCKAGQFIEIKVIDKYLRRPISISKINPSSIEIIYKVLGEGTKLMTEMSCNVDIIGPLGNGFPTDNRKIVTIVGGGIGVAPLYEVAKNYVNQGSRVNVVLGFNTKADCYMEKEFESLGVDLKVATMDGSYGYHGNVIQLIEEFNINKEFILACGPKVMLKAIEELGVEGYISMEERMACGIGACMGCVVESKMGEKLRVCKDGPVFPLGLLEF